jgi:translation initiation factor IF-1
MSREGAFKVEGVIVQVLPNRTCQVELANGHRLCGFMTGRAKANFDRLAVGDKVMLEISPYDLSEGRIVSEAKHIGLG